jgi:hypothetical protein
VQLVEEVQEHVKVVAEGNVVDLEKTSTSTKFSDKFIRDLPVPGRFYQNVVTLAPGVQDSDGGDPNVHGSHGLDFKAVVRGIGNVDPLTGQSAGSVNPNSIEEMAVITAGARNHLLEAALRVLADLAEDGRLSPAEGIPALAALLAAQSPSGAVARDLRLQAVATWALAEAAAALPDESWVREADARATDYLIHHADRVATKEIHSETGQWLSLVLSMVRPEQFPEVAPAPGETSRSLRRLADALAAARTGAAGERRAGDHPFDRLVGSIPLGHLRVAG